MTAITADRRDHHRDRGRHLEPLPHAIAAQGIPEVLAGPEGRGHRNPDHEAHVVASGEIGQCPDQKQTGNEIHRSTSDRCERRVAQTLQVGRRDLDIEAAPATADEHRLEVRHRLIEHRGQTFFLTERTDPANQVAGDALCLRRVCHLDLFDPHAAAMALRSS
jgi:hypothetical protein